MYAVKLLYKFISILILATLISINLMAQNIESIGIPKIKTFTSNDYQVDNQFWSTFVDENNIKYFGNTAGLVIYDGKNWELVKSPTSDIVRCVTKYKDKIYLGLNNDIGLLTLNDKNKYVIISLKHLIPENIKFTDIWSVTHFNDKIIFRSGPTTNYRTLG